MITLAATIGLLVGMPLRQATPSNKPSTIQLQEKTYSLSKPMTVSGEGAVLDGHGATLSGNGTGTGLMIGGYHHVVVKNLKITGFATGLIAQGASDLSLLNVSVSHCGVGLRVERAEGGLLQGIQAHRCSTGLQLSGCSKLIVERNDLSLNALCGLDGSACLSCIIRDNKMASVGVEPKGSSANQGIGLKLENGSDHNQVLRNVAIRCGGKGIYLTADGNKPSSDNTLQSNEVSWTTTGNGIEVDGEPSIQLLGNTAGYCQVGFMLQNDSDLVAKGNIAVACSQGELEDSGGINSLYDSNVFQKGNGGAVAMVLKNLSGPKGGQVFGNIFMGFQKPLRIENCSPLAFQANCFPSANSLDLKDLADVIGKSPIFLDSQDYQPQGQPFVSAAPTSIGMLAQVPTAYDRVGGVSVSATHGGEMEIVVEGSLSGAFQGEEVVLARYKGELAVQITFPPVFDMFVRVREVAEKPSFLAFLALLGDNSVAKDMPAEDSGDTLFKPGLAVDGDTTSPDHFWEAPDKGRAGVWWAVDLKTDRTIDSVSILPNPANPSAFWEKFHIAVSNTGLFQGEETVAVTETNFSQNAGPLRIYHFPAVSGRFVRLIADEGHDPVQLQQFGVYGIEK